MNLKEEFLEVSCSKKIPKEHFENFIHIINIIRVKRQDRLMKEGITIVVHYPTTKEGMKALEESQARVMFSILENQLGPQMVEKLVARMKEKTTMDK